jgi:UPF0755 protein
MVAQKKKAKKKSVSTLGKVSILFVSFLLLLIGIGAFQLFGYIFSPNVSKDVVVFVPTGSTYDDVLKIVDEQHFIQKIRAFKWVAKKKDYPQNIKPGRYEFKKGMNTNQVVSSLRYGRQAPIRLTFNNIRTFEELAGKVSRYLEPDSSTFIEAFNKTENQKKYSLSKPTFSTLFIPNTYEFYWNTSPDEFIERMYKEHQRFWDEERMTKLTTIKLTKEEAVTLASIVQEETRKNDEKPIVAGLYLNRLKRGMPLQADPTVKYALKDFAARRITNDMLAVDSPYNTYRNTGLPPGPINFAEVTSIDAVLNATDHNYVYMCAKEDFSGYHNFATNLSQHNNNAAKYHRALNQRKIWK